MLVNNTHSRRPLFKQHKAKQCPDLKRSQHRQLWGSILITPGSHNRHLVPGIETIPYRGTLRASSQHLHKTSPNSPLAKAFTIYRNQSTYLTSSCHPRDQEDRLSNHILLIATRRALSRAPGRVYYRLSLDGRLYLRADYPKQSD